MSVNEESREWGNGAQGNSLQPHHNSTLQPCYEFYRQGITEPHNVWFEVIRNARGKYLVSVVVVLALCKIACEMLEKSIIGTLVIALMILSIVFIPLWRVEDKDAGQKEDREKDKDESAKSGTGGISPGQNRRTST
ncbi:MAG: hypothetical protein ABSG82_03415 [Sedimentisphaerales bacterium]|jgi:hypothetical protein